MNLRNIITGRVFTPTWLSMIAMLVLVVLSFAYMASFGVGRTYTGSYRTARLTVTATNGILVGSHVLLRGVEIGYIESVVPSADDVSVEWKYSSNYRIPADSQFRLEDLSALGEPYLAVLPPSDQGPFLRNGQTVLRGQVTAPTTFSALSARLTHALESVDPDQIHQIFEYLDVALPQDRTALGNMNRLGRLMATAIAARRDDLTTVLSTMQPLLMRSTTIPSDLYRSTPNLPALGRNFSLMLDGVKYAMDVGPLGDGIKYGASPLFKQLQTFLDKNAVDLKTIGVNLMPGVSAGAASLRTVDTGAFLAAVLRSLDTGDAVTIRLGRR